MKRTPSSRAAGLRRGMRSSPSPNPPAVPEPSALPPPGAGGRRGGRHARGPSRSTARPPRAPLLFWPSAAAAPPAWAVSPFAGAPPRPRPAPLRQNLPAPPPWAPPPLRAEPAPGAPSPAMELGKVVSARPRPPRHPRAPPGSFLESGFASRETPSRGGSLPTTPAAPGGASRGAGMVRAAAGPGGSSPW